MALGQALLDTMEVVFPELQLQSGEADVVKGLITLNRAQDTFEAILAEYPDVFGGQIGTITTTAATEYTAYPAGVLRMDGLDYIDASTSRPAWPLKNLFKRGGHAWHRFWPWNIVSTNTTGKPRGYWTDGTNVYWDPLPDATYTIRWYGFKAAADITAAGTFAYPDQVILPMAIFAVKVIRTGLDDPTGDLSALARDVFDPVIKQLTNFKRESAPGYQYRYRHDA